jgi:squalene-associated FAD-dependent desaturase
VEDTQVAATGGGLAERDAEVAVIGGGLAGITAALDCAEAGLHTTLVEVRPRLGGAAYSVQREGLTIDNGQHVFLRCCHAYRALLARLGSTHLTRLQPRLEIPLLAEGGQMGALRRDGLPAPLHLARALLSHRPLSLQQRLAAGFAAAALGRLDPTDPALDRQTLGEWLRRHRQSGKAISCLWDLVALPSLNVPAKEASLALGAFVFQQGLLSSADAGDVGFHKAPLSETIGDPALRVLSEAGVRVRLRWRARTLTAADGGFQIEGGDGPTPQTLGCQAAILALPHLRAAELLPPETAEIAQKLRAIGNSPIVNLHVLYDRRVCELPFAAGIETPVQYVFDRTRAGGGPAHSQYLAVSLSAAEREMELSVPQLRERYLPAIERLLPAARDAKVLRFLVTREHAATFKAAPGVGALRPGPRTPLKGLALAGAFTATGWPATLEGAVISGHAAAKAVLADLRATRAGASSAGALAGPASSGPKAVRAADSAPFAAGVGARSEATG